MIRVFEFRNPAPIEAFVLAEDSERAAQLFDMYLTARGGHCDTVRSREWPGLDKLWEPQQSLVREALALNREGLLARGAGDRWAIIIPLAAYRAAN